WSEKVEDLVAVEVRADDAVEADEVIDVMVRDEDRFEIAESLQVKAAVLASVEEQGVVLAGIVDEQHRVAGRAVDQPDLGECAHGGHAAPLLPCWRFGLVTLTPATCRPRSRAVSISRGLPRRA